MSKRGEDCNTVDDLTGKKVLIVDDDKDVLASLQQVLEETKADIETAMDGDTALEKVDTWKPDVMILDVMLPKRSGFLVLEKLRQKVKKDEPPRVIMITSNEGKRHRAYAESLGVDMYLNKPFRMQKLVDVVKELLSSKQ